MRLRRILFLPLRVAKRCFVTPRARNAFATHVPILVGLARVREIRNVLEFGSGHYSTLTFLNRSVYPHLERLHSIENDATWAREMQNSVNDRRWNLKLIDGDIASSVRDLDLEKFDLILIDDSKEAPERVATIRAIANKQPQHPLIAIHDFEVNDYRIAANTFARRHIFKAYNPQTGLLSNKEDLRVDYLDRLVKRNRKALEPDNVEGWLSALNP